jgi:hypothetical protein
MKVEISKNNYTYFSLRYRILGQNNKLKILKVHPQVFWSLTPSVKQAFIVENERIWR